MNGGGERTKKTSRKKWVPLAIDVRSSRGGRKDRVSGGGAPGGAASTRPGAGGRTRNRDSISKDTTGAAPAAGVESWRGDTERRATSFGKNPRGPRSAMAAGGPGAANAAAPMVNGGYRRPNAGRRAPGPAGDFKKGEAGRMVNGKGEAGATFQDLKNGAPLYYVPANYRAVPSPYLKECIRHQM